MLIKVKKKYNEKYLIHRLNGFEIIKNKLVKFYFERFIIHLK